MIKNDSFPKNIRFKKIEINDLRKNHIKKNEKNTKEKDTNSFVRTDNLIKEINKNNINKNINEHYIRKNNFTNSNSNLISLSKSSNNFLNKNRASKDSEYNNKKEKCYENEINNCRNSKNKNRYLTCFEYSISNKKNDENKINVLLNDFIFSEENKDKENINTNLQLETNYNKNNILIKVNKNNNFHTKKLYIEACEKLKEKIKNNISNDDNRKIENESRGNHILKISAKFMDKKRNTTNIIKKRYKKNFIDIGVGEDNFNKSNNNLSKNNYTSLVKSRKFSNSFNFAKKDLFLKNNNIKKNKNGLFIENKSPLDSQNSFKNEEEKKINNRNKNNTKFSSIIKYEQRKIKVFKNKCPTNLMESEKDLTIENDNNKNNIDNISNFKSPKNDDIFRTLSFNKENNFNNNRHNNIYNYFSFDLSLKEEKENKKDEKNKNSNNLLLSPINNGKTSNKRINSLSKKRYIQKKSKKNLDNENFNFDELNEKLFNIIKNLESQEIKKEIRHCFHSRKNEDGFIKWDIFEKIIQDN